MSGVINSILNLRDNFSPTLRRVSDNSKKFKSDLKSAETTVNKMTSSLSKLTKIAAGIGVAGVAGMGVVAKASIDTFKDFEQAMAQTAGTAGIEQSSEGYAKMEKAARDAGKATTKTAKESADALGYMALAGWSVDDSIKGLTPILRLSEATQADLASTSDLVTDSMSALGVSVDELGHYLDVTTVANNKSNQTAQMLMEAYIGVGGTFTRLETPLNESAALLGVLANRGIKAGEAGNSLNSLLINLTKKSGESAEAMEGLGIKAYDAQGNFKGVTNVLKELNNKTKSLTSEQRDLYLQMIGGKTQITTLNALMSGLNTTNAEGVNELEALNRQLQNTDGALNKMADTVNNTMSGAFARMGSAIDDAKIEIGSKIAPLLTPLINSFAEKLPRATEKFGKSVEKLSSIFSNFLKLASGKFYWKEGQDLRKELNQLTGINIASIEKIAKGIRKIQDIFAIVRNFLKLAGGKIYWKEGQELRKELNHLTGINIASIEKIAKEIKKIQDTFKSFLDMDTIIPTIAGVVSALGSFIIITKVARFMSGLIQTGGKLTKILKLLNLTMLANPFFWVAAAIGALVAAFVLAYRKSETFRNFVNKLWGAFKELAVGLGTVVFAKLQELKQWFDEKIKPALTRLGESLNALWINVLQPLAEYLAVEWGAQIAGVFSFIGDSFETVVNSFMALTENTISFFTGMTDFLTGIFTKNWELALQGAKEIFSATFGGLKGIAMDVINCIIDGINNMTFGINTFSQKIGSLPGFGWAANIEIPKIPKFALGTQYFQGGLAEINERGGEIVKLRSGAQIIPADKSDKLLEPKPDITVKPQKTSQPPIINVAINIQGHIFSFEDIKKILGDMVANELLTALSNI